MARTQRFLARLLATSLLVVGSAARATTVLVPDFVDDDPSEAIKTRTTILKAVGAIPGLAIAPLSKYQKLAKAHHLNPKQLGNAPAAKLLCHVGKLDGVFAGLVDEQGGRRVLHLVLYAPDGKALFKTDAALTEGDLRQDQVDRISRALATVVSPDEPVVRRPVKGKPDPDSADGADGDAPVGREPVKPRKRDAEPVPEIPEINEERDERERQEREHPRHRDDDADGEKPKRVARTDEDKLRQNRFEDPTFELDLGFAGATQSSVVTNFSPTVPVNFTDLESGFYPGFVARVQSYPFHALLNAASGLGVQATFSYGAISLTPPTGASFSTSDTRFSALLDYRRTLPFVDGESAVFNPRRGLRAGLQLWNVDPATNNGVNLYANDRFGPFVGGELVEAFGHYVRLIAGGQYYFSPYPGSGIEKALGALQTFSFGYGFDGELQGHLGGANESALTAGLKFQYTEFDDCFEQVAGQGCYYGTTQATIDFWLMLGYAFY